ncbi:ISXO2-like domain-containing [Brachionus plicatilis]|uniref:ISXO2-like domain-containing n=1 Tax=Brachionus plicatilis TaxID=10195 RepID=A0A3M7P4L7_BRAPC|nr:ISXO2-like domain-containing [Brachionus plicatilis]
MSTNKNYGLVYPPRACANTCCKKFGETMAPYLQKRSKNAKNQLLYWRCSSCGRFKTAYDESFFSLFKKSPAIVIGLIKCWAGQLTVAKSISMVQLNLEQNVCEEMVCTLFYRLRQVCSIGIDKDNIKLGGNGKIVEIDESLYARVKHNKGKDLKRAQVWVFGLVERNDHDSKCFMIIVPDREATTLLNIIYSKCMPGSIIYSDCWSSYSKINKLKDFKHFTVNHSLNFIDPDTGACTNKIESLWHSCKAKFKDMNGCTRPMLQSYIDEYVWRYNNNCTTDRKIVFDLMLKELGKNYKPGQKLMEFDKSEQEEEIFDIDSQSGSETGSDRLDELDDLEKGELESGVQRPEEDELSVQNLVERSTHSNTLRDENEEISDEDAESFEEIEEPKKVKDKIEQLTEKLQSLSSDVKKKATLCEIKSLEQPKSSDDQMLQIKKILSNKKNPIACELCGQFMNGEKGIQIHMARKHK